MSIFLRLDHPIADIVAFLTTLLGTTVADGQTDDGYRSLFSCLDLEFYVHGLQNDREIPSDTYDVEIDVRKLGSGEPIPGYEAMLHGVANYLAARLSSRFGCETRVVANLQKTIAIYVAGTPARL